MRSAGPVLQVQRILAADRERGGLTAQENLEHISRSRLPSGTVASAVVQLVFVHFAAKGVAMDSQCFGGARLISVQALQHSLDEFLLEFRDRFFEQNPAL